MPREKPNFEILIFDYFRDKPIEQVRLVFGVVKHIMRKREKNFILVAKKEEKAS